MLPPIEDKIGRLITAAGEAGYARSFNPHAETTWASVIEEARQELLQALAPWLELPEKLRLLADNVEVYSYEGVHNVLIELAESVEPVVEG